MNEPEMARHLVDGLAGLDTVIHAPARLLVVTYLAAVESADYVFLRRLTGLTWGNLATHLGRLQEAGYIDVEKSFKGKKPHTMLNLTPAGRTAFQAYKAQMQTLFNDPTP